MIRSNRLRKGSTVQARILMAIKNVDTNSISKKIWPSLFPTSFNISCASFYSRSLASSFSMPTHHLHYSSCSCICSSKHLLKTLLWARISFNVSIDFPNWAYTQDSCLTPKLTINYSWGVTSIPSGWDPTSLAIQTST